MRVLVAEDDPVASMVVAERLRRAGHEVVVVSDGAAALRALLDDEPTDVAILDWLMPGLDGLEVVQRMRTDPRTRDCPVILVTGVDGADERLDAYEAGVQYVLVKPLVRGVIERLVAELARRDLPHPLR